MASPRPVWTRILSLVGLLGLLPFAAALAFTLWPEGLPLDALLFERALLGYGALILSFLSGIRWGIRMQGGAGTDLIYVAGIAGCLTGFATLLLPYQLGLAVLTVVFGAHGAWDVWAGYRNQVPSGYGGLRQALTWAVCALLIATIVARAFVNS